MSVFSALALKNRRYIANIRRILRVQSRFKVLFIFFFAVIFETGLFKLFLDGFQLISRLSSAGFLLMPRLFTLFFLAMGIMLVVSGIVSSYTTIFRSDEVPFLLVRPLSMREIVVYRFFSSTWLSSWAFLFILFPFVSAFAAHGGVSVFFPIWTTLFSIPFLIICSSLGSLVTMAFVRWYPRGRVARYIAVMLAAGVVAWLYAIGRTGASMPIESNLNLSRLVPGMAVSSNKLLPSWWIAEGVMSLTRDEWLRGSLFWLLLSSTAGIMTLVVEFAGGKIFYEGWQKSSVGAGKAATGSFIGSIVDKMLFFVHRDTRTLIVKDVKTFLRDPQQWSQALIFFGLLAIYFSNLRTFNYHTYAERWRNLIAFLNVFSVSAVMCSLGSRFVYPQLSLEGHGFWILGLSPITYLKIVMAKFCASAFGMSILSVGLMLLSSHMLQASLIARLVSSGIALCVALAVCALSTGLGAIFLNHEEKNPAAIVSGFGGTLNLVFCLCFMLAAILPFAFIFHLRLGGMSYRHYVIAATLGGVWLLVITCAATAIPLFLGLRSLKNREY